MFIRLYLILVGTFIECLIVPIQRTRDNEQICLDEPIRLRSHRWFDLCYRQNIRHRSILISFTSTMIDRYFHAYRFVQRSIDDWSLTTIEQRILSNFTAFIDKNNSLRLMNLRAGHYEICLELQSNYTQWIYQPRESCIAFRFGATSHGIFRQSSIELFFTLAVSITLFFVLGLVVQWRQTNRKRHEQLLLEEQQQKQQQQQQQRSWSDHCIAEQNVSAHRCLSSNSIIKRPDIYIIPLDDISKKYSRNRSCSTDDYVII
jgi:heme exporter protein D